MKKSKRCDVNSLSRKSVIDPEYCIACGAKLGLLTENFCDSFCRNLAFSYWYYHDIEEAPDDNLVFQLGGTFRATDREDVIEKMFSMNEWPNNLKKYMYAKSEKRAEKIK